MLHDLCNDTMSSDRRRLCEQVKHVILCGHTNCGAVAGSLSFPPDAPGTVNLWLADLKDTAQHHAEMIYHEGNDKEKTDTCGATSLDPTPCLGNHDRIASTVANSPADPTELSCRPAPPSDSGAMPSPLGSWRAAGKGTCCGRMPLPTRRAPGGSAGV